MRQLVGKRGLWEPRHTHYSLQYGDKGGEKKRQTETERSETVAPPLFYFAYLRINLNELQILCLNQ